MTTKVVTIEAGGLVRIPPTLLEQAGIRSGEELEVQPRDGWLALRKKTSVVKRLRGRLKLDQRTAEEILFAPELEYETC